MAHPRVTKFDGTGAPGNSKGSKHPDMGPGRDKNRQVEGGGPRSAGAQTGGSDGKRPKGVSKRSGAEDLGTKVASHTGALVGAAPGGTKGVKAWPAGLHRFDGTKAPKRIK